MRARPGGLRWLRAAGAGCHHSRPAMVSCTSACHRSRVVPRAGAACVGARLCPRARGRCRNGCQALPSHRACLGCGCACACPRRWVCLAHDWLGCNRLPLACPGRPCCHCWACLGSGCASAVLCCRACRGTVQQGCLGGCGPHCPACRGCGCPCAGLCCRACHGADQQKRGCLAGSHLPCPACLGFDCACADLCCRACRGAVQQGCLAGCHWPRLACLGCGCACAGVRHPAQSRAACGGWPTVACRLCCHLDTVICCPCCGPWGSRAAWLGCCLRACWGCLASLCVSRLHRLASAWRPLSCPARRPARAQRWLHCRHEDLRACHCHAQPAQIPCAGRSLRSAPTVVTGRLLAWYSSGISLAPAGPCKRQRPSDTPPDQVLCGWSEMLPDRQPGCVRTLRLLPQACCCRPQSAQARRPACSQQVPQAGGPCWLLSCPVWPASGRHGPSRLQLPAQSWMNQLAARRGLQEPDGRRSALDSRASIRTCFGLLRLQAATFPALLKAELAAQPVPAAAATARGRTASFWRNRRGREGHRGSGDG